MASRRILTGLLALAVLVQAAAQANVTEFDVVLFEQHDPADFNGSLSGRRLSTNIAQCMCVAKFDLLGLGIVQVEGVLETTQGLNVQILKDVLGDKFNRFSANTNFVPATLTTPAAATQTTPAIATCQDGAKVPGTKTDTVVTSLFPLKTKQVDRVKYTGQCVVGDVDEKACQLTKNGWVAVETAGPQSGKICQDLQRPASCTEVCKQCPPNSHYIAAAPARCECDSAFEPDPDQGDEACRADVRPPVVKCPAGMKKLWFENVTWAAPTASDESISVLSVTCDHQSGAAFTVGIHKVTCSATDAAGKKGECSFDVEKCPKYADVVEGACKCRFGPAVTNPSAGPCEPGMWVRISSETTPPRRGSEF